MTSPMFAAPTKVTEMPPAPARGGKQPIEPVLQAWLDSLPQDDGTYELVNSDEKQVGHPTSRVAVLRKLAGESFKIDTRTIETGKRYRIFATRTPKADAKADAKRKTA